MSKTFENLKKDLFSAETIRYAIVGVISVAIDFGIAAVVKNLCFSSGNYLLSTNAAVTGTIVGWVCASVATFFGNKIFVFKSKGWSPLKIIKEFFGTIGTRGFSFLISSLGMKVFVDMDILNFTSVAVKNWGWSEKLAKEIVLFWVCRCIFGIIEVVLNYIMNKLVIFTKPEKADKSSTKV